MINIPFIIATVSAIVLLPFIIYLIVKVFKAKNPVLFTNTDNITYLFKYSSKVDNAPKEKHPYRMIIILFCILILSIILLIYKIPS